ncbi:maltose alpha-D-glucosyltransferase / alpha-amylase [Myxococcaceae bacterium]|jgi:maltose alpha-D-glucosyltransferase/alpha-amylase|nr:maltose alpha-D-glucosyltransferase / alpha-amylase [Myxococcaceae bacterium]
MSSRKSRGRNPSVAPDSDWYKDAILYEVRIGAFQDSDGDGIGDLVGLTQRLDYLEDLGVTTLWLLPFYPSPMKDDGYDISDYTRVHPESGTLEDFERFLDEAHRRGLRVMTELVINHTSDRHPWFQRARRSPPGSRFRDYYVWSETPDRYPEARIIFKDFEPSNWSWDPVARAYYWHRFYSHQPDLNFESADVRREILRVIDFWFELGVDALRLDAIPYLFEREGTGCENLPETHDFLRALRAHVEARWRDRMLLAEANQWPEDAAAYFGDGDQCHMAFHFPLMPRLFMSLHLEDRFPILDILQQTPPIPDSCQWALFLRNHDELTLEMVTDEERDYMYRVYASDSRARINLGIRRRLAPLLGNDRRRIELMNALLFSLPGTPVLYYGDEIGMGDNYYLGDRNGVRTPMQWSSDRNAGFSRSNPQRLHLPVIIDPEYHFESVNVEAQRNNLHSLLMWTRRLIALRKRHRAFGRGTIEFLTPRNHRVLAFVRSLGDERILVVANLSRFVEYVELDLSRYSGRTPIELFGRKPFPRIGELPYLLTLGPHSFYWFAIAPSEAADPVAEIGADATRTPVQIASDPRALFGGAATASLETALAGILEGRRWFGGKTSMRRTCTLVDAVEIGRDGVLAWLAIVRVETIDGGVDVYALPIAVASGRRAEEIRSRSPHAILAELVDASRDGRSGALLYEAAEEPAVALRLLDMIAGQRTLRGRAGAVSGTTTSQFRSFRDVAKEPPRPSPLRVEQTNTSIAFGEGLILKLIRRLGEGTNPELEIGRFLTERTGFTAFARVLGAIEYQSPRGEPLTLGLLFPWVENEEDAWRHAVDCAQQFFDRIQAHPERGSPPPDEGNVIEAARRPISALGADVIGGYLETARLLGRRTAELHAALASDRDDPSFAPEPFTSLYQRSLYQSMRNSTYETWRRLREATPSFSGETRSDAERVLGLEAAARERFHEIVGVRLSAMRIRCHGDLHLGQILHTGSDIVFIDFEGEPARTLSQRRLKRSPLRDVAGMLRSFDYAARGTLLEASEAGTLPADSEGLARWARFWSRSVGAAYLSAYLERGAHDGLVPSDPAGLERLLRVLLLEKCVYEIAYELAHRPGWIRIPLCGVIDLLGG